MLPLPWLKHENQNSVSLVMKKKKLPELKCVMKTKKLVKTPKEDFSNNFAENKSKSYQDLLDTLDNDMSEKRQRP